MTKKKLVGLVIISSILILTVIGLGAYELGRRADKKDFNNALHATQGQLAFFHYKVYKDTQFFLENECYEAALKNITEMKNLQIETLAINLQYSEYDPELIEYIKLRDPELLERVLKGNIPEFKPFSLPCTKEGCECK